MKTFMITGLCWMVIIAIAAANSQITHYYYIELECANYADMQKVIGPSGGNEKTCTCHKAPQPAGAP